jgi:hypothetical protein
VPQNLGVLGEDSQRPTVALDPAGDAVVVWAHTVGNPVTGFQIQSAARPAGGAWGPPQDVSVQSVNADLTPQIGLDATGNAIAVWRRFNGSQRIIQSSRRPAGGVWSMPQDLSALGQNATEEQVAVDPAGNAIAVWKRSNGTNDIVQAASRPVASGVWQLPQDLSAIGQNASAPQIALNAAGTAAAVWYRFTGTEYAVQSAVRSAAGAWGATKDLSAVGQSSYEAQVAIDPAGNAVAAWHRFTPDKAVLAAGYDAAGPVLAGLSIPATGVAGRPVRFAVSPFDVWSALAGSPSWTFGDGAGAGGAHVSHTYRRAGSYSVGLSQTDSRSNSTFTSRVIRIVTKCVVPRVVGKTLAAAKRSLKRAHCRAGAIRSVHSARIGRGRVVSQKVRAGRVLALNAKVGLSVSLGPR